jgi:tetratricopeptide (TPR) repeat protein
MTRGALLFVATLATLACARLEPYRFQPIAKFQPVAPPATVSSHGPSAYRQFDAHAEAKRHFNDGMRCAERQECECAAKEFETADAIKPAPAAQYNAALAREACGDYERAIEWYSRYLASEPDDELWVTLHIGHLKKLKLRSCTPYDKLYGMCKPLSGLP